MVSKKMYGNNNEVLVSIIIPVYNVEQYIEQCLESAVNQTLKEIEVIVIDDGATDSSGDIADDYAKKYDNLKVIHKPNGGLGSARNAGLQHAKGEYIYFLDSDDYIELNAMEALYFQSKQENLDILFFSAKSFYENPELQKIISTEQYKRKSQLGKIMSGKESFLCVMREREYMTSVCIRFYRREFLINGNFTFKEGIIHEDEAFAFLTYVYSSRVKIISDAYFHRRVRNNSIMTSKKICNSTKGYLYAWKQVIGFYKNADWNNDEKKVCIQFSTIYLQLIMSMYCDMNKDERKENRAIFLDVKDEVLPYRKLYGERVKLFLLSKKLYVILYNVFKTGRMIAEKKR